MDRKPDEKWLSLSFGKVHIRFTTQSNIPWDRFDFIPFFRIKKYKWDNGLCGGYNTYTVTFCWLRTDFEIFFNKWWHWGIKIYKFWDLIEQEGE